MLTPGRKPCGACPCLPSALHHLWLLQGKPFGELKCAAEGGGLSPRAEGAKGTFLHRHATPGGASLANIWRCSCGLLLLRV